MRNPTSGGVRGGGGNPATYSIVRPSAKLHFFQCCIESEPFPRIPVYTRAISGSSMAFPLTSMERYLGHFDVLHGAKMLYSVGDPNSRK